MVFVVCIIVFLGVVLIDILFLVVLVIDIVVLGPRNLTLELVQNQVSNY